MPPRINGIRRPIFVLVRSLSAPKNGSKNSASTLSAAMIAPEMVSSKWNVFVKISGMMLSYICQNAQMDKNASPTSTVRLWSSFIDVLLAKKSRFP